jgi:hypothetical protein
MTSIDTIYEYAGLKLAGSLWAIFSSVGLPLILALAGLAYAVHSIADKGSIRPLGVHLMYLILAAGMLGSTTQQGVKTPRFVAYLGQATDLLQKRAVKEINGRFLTEPFEWERIAARVSFARVLDPALERDIGLFLASCGRTTLARAEPGRANLLRDGALPYEKGCEDRRKSLWQRLQRHVQEDPHHKATVEAARAKDPAQGAAFAERYADELVVRAIDEPGGPMSEGALVTASLGQYSYTDPTQYTGSIPGWAKATMGVAGLLFGDEIANVAITGLAELNQNYENRFAAKQKYYLVVTYGPHVYGLALMVLLGLFPVAGLFALVPNQWKVFINYSKVFISVKLWPVGWTLLSTFNERRGALEAFESPERVTGSPFMAIAMMYLLVPGLAFLIVHLAAAAAALPFAPALPPAAGPGLGPVAPAVNVAARLSR